MNDMMSGMMGAMWIWVIAGLLLVVVLILAISKLSKK